MTSVQLFVRTVMNTPWCLGIMGFVLVFVPIIGMHLVHKYGWEHWEPFSKHEPHTETPGERERSSVECDNIDPSSTSGS